jgi:hypothetical protein
MSDTQSVILKLRESGLDLRDAKALGMKMLAPMQTAKLFAHHNRPAIQLCYYHPITRKLIPDVYRVRLLGTAPVKAFGAVEDKPLKYLQPSGSHPAAYFPLTVDWKATFADREKTILITEGELKSACAAKHGFACIGLGGISSWRSAPRGWALLPDLEIVPWAARDVIIIYDSDGADKPEVRLAASKLADTLMQKGAVPQVIALPALPEVAKTGLDDFLVARGRDAFLELTENGENDELARKLWQFNSRFTFIMNPGLVYDEQLRARYDAGKFHTAVFANVMATKIIDEAKIKQVPVAEEWIRWPLRRSLNAFTYKPGDGPVVDGCMNEWSGWGCSPAAGDMTPWSTLMDFLFIGADPAARAWFEAWCLWPLAHPGAKLLTATGIWSHAQGVGKSLIGESLGRVYGNNYSLISQRELESQFNGWSVAKQFVMVDDLSAYDSRAKADILKKLITQQQQMVNIKCLPTYQIPDCVNYYITSNRPNAFYLEDNDRRFFVHEVGSPEPMERDFYQRYMDWLAGPGPSAILAYAQKYKFGAFDPEGSAPLTAAKHDMSDAAKTELDQWLAGVAEAPDETLRLDSMEYTRDLFTSMELFRMFDRVRVGPPVNVNAVRVAVRGILPQAPGGPMRVNGGPSERFFVARNYDKWIGAAPAAIVKHINNARAREQGQKQKGRKY